MRIFNYSAIKNQKWDSEILGLIAAIYKEVGKQELYLKQRPDELDKLVEIAKIQSIKASNAIEGIVRSGFYVGKYVSLEAKIAKNKDLYYEVLAAAQTGWHEGTEDVVLFIKYLLGTILAAYKDFEDRMALVETKLPVFEMVRRASQNKIGRFNKQDIRELCPTLSDSSIEGALRKLIASGDLKKEGKGKNTCYFRLN